MVSKMMFAHACPDLFHHARSGFAFWGSFLGGFSVALALSV